MLRVSERYNTHIYNFVVLIGIIYCLIQVGNANDISGMVCSGKVLAQFHGPEFEVTSMRSDNYIERAFAYIMGALPDDPVISTPVNWICPHLAGSPSCCNQRALDVISSATLQIRDVVRDFANRHYLKAFDHEGAVWLKQQEACTYNVTMNKIEADKGGQSNVHRTCTWWKNFVSEMKDTYRYIEKEVIELLDSLVEYSKASLCLFCDPSVNSMFAAEYDENNNLTFEIHMRGKAILERITNAFLNYQSKLEGIVWSGISYYFPMDSTQEECAKTSPEWECNTGADAMMQYIGLPGLSNFNHMMTGQILDGSVLTNLAETFNGLSISPFLEVLQNESVVENKAYRVLIEDSDANQAEAIPREGTVLYLLDQKIEGALDLTETFTWSVRPPEPDFEEEEQEYSNFLNVSRFTMGIIVGILLGLIVWGLFTAVIFYWLHEMADHGLDFASRRRQRETAEAIEEQEEEVKKQKKKMIVAEDRRAKDLAIERAEIKREQEKQKLADKKKKLRMQERRRAGPPVETLKQSIGRDSPASSGPPSLSSPSRGGPSRGRPRGRVMHGGPSRTRGRS